MFLRFYLVGEQGLMTIGTVWNANAILMSTEELLEQERKRIRSKLAHLYETLRSTIDPDIEDAASELEEQEHARALVRELEGQLSSLDLALKKVEQGTYGICERCGQPIDPARLEAVPETTLCLSCKQITEGHGRSRTSSRSI
jgi:DnaK suppressor protein